MTIATPRLNRLPAAESGITIGDFLVPIRVGERLSSRARHVVLIIAGALFIAVCAQLTIVQTGQTIPLIADFRIQLANTPVPITGQTFAVLLVGGALGARRGVLSVALYLLLGLFLPFYAPGPTSGIGRYILSADGGHVVLGTTGGYLIGFVLAAAVTGRLAELGWDRHTAGAVAAMFIGNVVIYVIGVPWLALALSTASVANPLDKAVALGLAPFVIVDIAKLLLAALLFPAAWWIVGRRPGER
jgi:biotin transport system substrate-specific component